MSGYEILIEGKKLEWTGWVIDVTVLQDVSAPGMFTVRMTNEEKSPGEVTRSSMDLFKPGNKVRIFMGPDDKLLPVMTGEITGLEPEFRGGGLRTITVRGYDLIHRLMRGTKTRSFTQQKDSDIAASIALKANLVANVDNTGVTLDYVMQHNQTDFEFLQARARRLGFEIVAEGEELKFRKHREDTAPVLTLNKENLKELSLRLSTKGQVGEVVVQGWNSNDKELITGRASAGDLTTMGDKSGLGEGVQIAVIDQPVQNQEEADRIALGRLREMALNYITGEGETGLNPALQAGTVVNIQGYEEPFNGPYYLTWVRHTCSSSNGYRTAFKIGLDPFAGFAGPSPEADRMPGMVIGVVTENDNPEHPGCVKLRFPWLSEKHGSHWARMVPPMAGKDCGLYLLPEIDDAVLVAFEHGRIERPYVLGALWSSKDTPPGKNKVRVLRSRSGHVIRLDDTDGGEKIEIVDAKGKQSLVFDTAAGTLTVTADQDVAIESKNGLIKLSGQKGVEITAPSGAVKLEAGQNLEVKASGQVNVKGSVINLN